MADVIGPDEGDLSPEVARSVLRWKFTDPTVARMTELSDRNSKGRLSPSEREELDKYLRVGSFINLVQAKARLSLHHPRSLD
ncbi:MAG: hypothetical protein NTY19_52430 [Planctomycetota bacterium]|nr:hypothetical protein [Planctomycetota bacterium]